MSGAPLYHETQSFSPWVTALVLAAAVLVGALLFMRLATTVTADAISVRYGLLYRTKIPLSEVARAQAVEYAPIREYGGWGIRGSSRRRALNARGNRGVLLTRADGRTVLVGSQRPRELLDALARAGVVTEDRLPIVVKEF